MSQNRKIYFNQPIQVTGLEVPPHLPHEEETSTSSLPTKGVIIPFCRGECGTNYTLTNASGVSTGVMLCTFGMTNGSTTTLTNPATSNPSFTQSIALNNHAFTFVMPYDGTLRSIYMNSCNYYTLGNASSVVTPYVALYTADPGTTTFTLLSGTKTPAAIPWTGSTISNSVTTGYQSGLNISIPAGTRIAIVGGCDSNGLALTQWIEYAGALYLSQNE